MTKITYYAKVKIWDDDSDNWIISKISSDYGEEYKTLDECKRAVREVVHENDVLWAEYYKSVQVITDTNVGVEAFE